MIQNVSICQILVTAFLVFSRLVVTNICSFFDLTLIEDFSVEMEETPVLERKMRHWILFMGDTTLKMISSIDLVKPNSELGVSDSW